MAEEKDKKEIEETELKDNYVSESYIKKFIKTGLLAVGTSALLKGKNSDLLKVGVTTAATLALSDDKDYSKDAIVLASLFGVKNAVGLGKAIAKTDFSKFQKAYQYAEKADDVFKNFNLASMNVTSKIVESYASKLSKIEAEKVQKNDSIVSGFFSLAQKHISTSFGVTKDALSYLYQNGFQKSLENINNNSFYNSYKQAFGDIRLKDLEVLSNDIENSLNLNIKNTDVNSVSSYVDSFINSITKGRFFSSKQEQYLQAQETIKKFKKFQRIEESSFFTDMFGMYTKLDGNTVDLRLDRLLNDRMHFAEGLEKLSDNFVKIAQAKSGRRYDELSNEVKTGMFLDYLKENGFGELVEKAYNKENALTFADVNEMIKNGTNGIEDFFNSATKSKTTFINDQTREIKNLDLLKDFSFTNVVRKTANGFSDETALNGHINMMQLLGAVEKNTVGAFKIPILDRVINTWNPFKLIDSNARTKNYLVNDVMGFYKSGDDFILNGMRIAKGETIKVGKTEKIATYIADNRRDARVIFNKNLLEIMGENFSVNKETQKQNTGYRDLFSHLFVDKKGIRSTFEEATKSQINPFSFRYDSTNKSFRYIKESEANFKDGSFFSQYFGKADIDISKMKAENDLIETYITEMKNYTARVITETTMTDKNIREELSNQVLSFLQEQSKISEIPRDNKVFKALNDLVINRVLANPQMTYTKRLEEIDNMVNKFIERGLINPQFSENTKQFFGNIASQIELMSDNQTSFINVFNNNKDAMQFVMHNIGNKSSRMSEVFINRMSQFGDEIGEVAKRIQNTISDYDEEMLKMKKNFNNLIQSKSATYRNFIDEYNQKISLDDSNNIFNPIYEISKGFTLNRVVKNNLDEDFLKDLGDGGVIGKAGTSPDYATTTLGSIKGAITDMFSNDDTMLHTMSYKIFDDMEEFLSKEKTNIKLEKLTFDQLIDQYNKAKFTEQKEPKASAIIRSTELSHRNMKNILNDVRETIYNLISGNKRNKDELESKFNLLSKVAISNLQDAMEYIGVERLTQNTLGDNGLEQIYKFMKYRYLPLAAIFGGAIALDTASDALIPDDVPIIGNGISGVAVKGIAASRIGLQYMLQGTGMLSLMRGMENAIPGIFNNAIGDSLDILMSPSEMIEVYFKGKPIEIRDNRWWFTAGRQSAQGEEFRQYRPHLWYIWQNKDSGIYSNKFEKLFRRDLALTKYPWYLLDPYKEEREAYEKYGVVYPMTEQLFLEVPVIGQFLNATLGEVIKPTQYIGEERWRVGDDMMLNPDYNPNDPSSPKYIQFSDPNKFTRSFFEAVEDLKTFAGLPGYAVTKVSELFFGSSNPYQNEVGLASIDQDTGLYSRYDELQLGDLFGMTEPIRRLIDDSNGLGMIKMNPLEQNLPEWMPEYFRHGNNPYMSWDFGNYILPGREFNRNENNNSGNEELNQFRILSLIAPSSSAFSQLKNSLNEKVDSFTPDEQQNYYESLAYAENYGEREYLNRGSKVTKDVREINLTIDKKISPYEFISDGRRYKLDTVTDNFNMLSERYGSKRATKMINNLNNTFQEGNTYSFKISNDASYSVGIDEDGDYFKIDSELISDKYDLEKSGYRKHFTLPSPLRIGQNAPMGLPFEKIFGIKSIYNEWANETVEAPFFRDWDTPVSSFLMPFYTYSSNYVSSAASLSMYANSIYLNNNASFNMLGTLNKAGMLKLPFNKLLGNMSVSGEYEDETRVHDELEKIKFIAGDKSYFNMTGKEKLGQFSDMVNEQDAVFLKDLANVSNQKEREKILNIANDRLANVLKTIWNRHQMAINNTLAYEDVNIGEFNSAIDIGAYYGNAEEARNKIKTAFGINLSKLDAKRQGIFNAYRGVEAEREADFIYNRMYRQYNSRPYISSTIYGNGTINVNSRSE